MARILSVNVGTPREIGRTRRGAVRSSIFKQAVSGRVAVKKLNLEGDAQADLSVHGGENKALYAYASEHYKFWQRRFPSMDMPWGTFGENLTTRGLLEKSVRVGDELTVGSSLLEVTEPRFPCFKLGIRFGTENMIKLFLESERSGFYLKVLKEGEIQAGDAVKLIRAENNSETIASIVRRVKREG